MNSIYQLGIKIQESGIPKKIRDLLPYKFFYSIGKVFDCFYFPLSGNKKLVSKNSMLKDTRSGKRAFILATGPSINSEKLELLKDEDCFSISNFFLHKDIGVIKPKYHFFYPFHKPLILENYIERLTLADKTLPKETKIFLGHTDKQYIENFNIFKNREVNYLYFSEFAKKSNTNLCLPIRIPHTSPQMIIHTLIYMGYKRIYLLGCDHNTLKTYGKDRNNFYNKNMDIRKNAADKNSWSNDIIDALKVNIEVFEYYKYLKRLSEKNNVEIINLSNDTRLNYFKKESLVNIIKN